MEGEIVMLGTEANAAVQTLHNFVVTSDMAGARKKVCVETNREDDH